MIRFLSILLLTIGLSQGLKVLAEEHMVTTPLLTQLSSTTISGYIDTSAPWNPGMPNVEVVLPNGKISSVTPRDLQLLRWALKSKQINFFRTFIAIKQRQAAMDANEFDAKHLQLISRFSRLPGSPARGIGGRSSLAPF